MMSRQMLDLGEGSSVGSNIGSSMGKVVGNFVGIDELDFSVGAKIGFQLYVCH